MRRYGLHLNRTCVSHFGNERRKRNSFRYIPWFRILLWWGTEVSKQIFTVRRPRPQIVRLSRFDRSLPISSWVFIKDRVYALFSRRDVPEVRILEFEKLEMN